MQLFFIPYEIHHKVTQTPSDSEEEDDDYKATPDECIVRNEHP